MWAWTPPAAGGVLAAQMWSLLDSRDTYAGTNDQNYPHAIAEMSKRAYAERSHWLDQNDNFVGDPASVLAPAHIATLLASYRPEQAAPAATPPGQPDSPPAGAPDQPGSPPADQPPAPGQN